MLHFRHLLLAAQLSLCCIPRHKYRLSHEGPGDISFIARGVILYFVTSERSEREPRM